MAKEHAELVLGDEVSMARALAGAHVDLITPDGQEVVRLRLSEVAGEVRALRVR